MQVKSAQAAIANAEAQLKQAEGNLVIAQKNLTDSVVRAPFHCIVTDKYVEQSEYVSVGRTYSNLRTTTIWRLSVISVRSITVW